MKSEDGGPWMVFLVATEVAELSEAWTPRQRTATLWERVSLENIIDFRYAVRDLGEEKKEVS